MSSNERAILDLVRRRGQISRAEITKISDLTAQSVSRILRDLLKRGYLRMGKTVSNGRGHPSPLIALKRDAAYSVGISIMTDAICGAMMDFAGAVLEQTTVPLTDLTLDHVLNAIETLKTDMVERQVRDPKRLFGLGVGVTGFFVGQRNQVNPPTPLDELAFVDLDQVISEKLELPVWIDNDGNVAAMGEALAGAGQSFDTFAYVYFSKGLGGSLVIDRRVFRGAFGNAGEFAGILSRKARAQRPTLELLRVMLSEHGVEKSSIQSLIDNFNPDWPGVDEWVATATPHMTEMISAITAVFDPQAIVLGGRIPRPLAEKLVSRVRIEGYERRGVLKPMPKVIPSQLEGDATSIGAASAPLKAHFFI